MNLGDDAGQLKEYSAYRLSYVRLAEVFFSKKKEKMIWCQCGGNLPMTRGSLKSVFMKSGGVSLSGVQLFQLKGRTERSTFSTSFSS
jgi:hypothetical protein